MIPIDFPERNALIAERQAEYQTIPACILESRGEVVFCWKLTLLERLTVLVTGRVWHRVLTFGKPLQPQLLETRKPFVRKEEP